MKKNMIILQNMLCVAMAVSADGLPTMPPIPEIPSIKPVNTVKMGDAQSFQEEQLDIPIADGPFKPNWESIESNYPGTPQWLREAKIGFWVHFGLYMAAVHGQHLEREI